MSRDVVRIWRVVTECETGVELITTVEINDVVYRTRGE
jgi:hypothetical protein